MNDRLTSGSTAERRHAGVVARRTWIVAAGIFVLILLGGCGLFDSDEDDDGTAGTETTQGDATAPGDQLAAEAMLTIDAFPDGWSAEVVSDALSRSILEQTPGCFPDLYAFDQDLAGAASSTSFTDSSGNRVDARVVVFDDADGASAFLELLRGSGATIEECIASLLRASGSELSLPPDTSVDPVFAADSGLGDDSASVTAIIGSVNLEQSWIRVEEGVAIVVTVDATADFDATVYSDTLVDRMRTVFG